MLTYQEHITLHEQLETGNIGIKMALQLYYKDYKKGQKSWHTKDWKERRALVLKDKCERCSSTETLIIQHTAHPRSYADYKREITRKFTTDYINSNATVDKGEFRYFILQRYDYFPAPLCPACKGSTLVERKTKTPKYRCPKCHQEFDDSVEKTVDELIAIFYEDADAVEVQYKCFVTKEWKQKQNLANIKYWLQRERTKSNHAETIERTAFLLYLKDAIHYLSFADAITACLQCAYHDDIKKMDLCPTCKVNYKGMEYPTCIPCLPEEKRQAALEWIEFGKQWQQMHEDLGID